MKKRKYLLLVLLLISAFMACKDASDHDEKHGGEATPTYTCSMHPQVIKHEMGACPVCGMDLVPFEKNTNTKGLKVDSQRQVLANITTVRMGGKVDRVNASSVLSGRLVVNPEQSNYLSARIAGRVEELYVKETGIAVKKGQPLYKIYSEQLASLQQEYLMALAQLKQFAGDKLEQQLVESAKQKLILYGQTEAQLKRLRTNGQKSPFITVYAAQGGVVAEIGITEGQYVTEGSPMMRLESYQQLWVEADLYPNEAKKLKPGQKVKILVSGWENEPQWMTVDFVNPALQPGTQLTQMRGSIANPNGQWQPSLQVQVILDHSVANDSKLILPVDAVIHNETGEHVWVKTSKDTFEPKAVTTGANSENNVTITSGLSAGEEVVVTGAYLLYSEYVIKKGKNPTM